MSWENFKAAPVPQHDFHASANTGISYSWSARIVGENVDLLYAVEAFFYPEHSWVLEKSEKLLAHEQLHFDISELFARKLRKAMQEFHPKEHKDLKKSLQKLYEDIEQQRKAMQEQYDRETGHSENVAAQEQWEQKVAEELLKMRDYKAKD